MNWAMVLLAVASAQYHRADRLFQDQKFAEALSTVDGVLQLAPNSVLALTLKARLAMAANRPDVARQTLEQALRADADAHYARFLYGLQFYMANDLQRALPEFRTAHKQDPSDVRATQYLGMTEESLGNTGAALQLYEQAARASSKADVMLSAARLLLLLNRLPESSHWIEQALRREPNSRDAHFEYARLLLLEGKNAEAAGQAETALRLPQGETADRQIHYLLTRAYRDFNPTAAAKHAEAIR